MGEHAKFHIYSRRQSGTTGGSRKLSASLGTAFGYRRCIKTCAAKEACAYRMHLKISWRDMVCCTARRVIQPSCPHLMALPSAPQGLYIMPEHVLPDQYP